MAIAEFSETDSSILVPITDLAVVRHELPLPAEEEIKELDMLASRGLHAAVVMPAYKEGLRSTSEWSHPGDNLKDTFDRYATALDSYYPHRSMWLLGLYMDGRFQDDNADEIARSMGATAYVREQNKKRGETYMDIIATATPQLATPESGTKGVLVMPDADGSYQADTIIQLIHAIQEGTADMATVYRANDESQHESRMRKIGHDVLAWVRDFEAKTDVVDGQSGTPAGSTRAMQFTHKVIRELPHSGKQAPEWVTNHLMWRIARLAGMEVAQFEVTMTPRENSTMGDSLKDLLPAAWRQVRDTGRFALELVGKGKSIRQAWLDEVENQ